MIGALFSTILVERATAYLAQGAQSLPEKSGEVAPAASTWDFALLLVSIAIFTLSLFFLSEAVKILKWTFAGSRSSPDPESGELISHVSSALALMAWFIYAVVGAQIRSVDAFLQAIASEPKRFAPGFLLASLVPLVIAFFKLVVAVVVSLRISPLRATQAKPIWLVVTYLAFNLLTVAANVVILVATTRG